MICIVASTNRVPSVSIQMANYYATLLKEKNIESCILDLSELPEDFAFSALYENNGKNEAFNDFISEAKKAEQFLFVVPEYNGSFPGVVKTFIDALPYPSILKGKLMTLTGISSGPMGTALGLSHLTDILNYLGAMVNPMKVRIPSIEKNFSSTEGITNDVIMKAIEEQLLFLSNR